MKRLIILLLMFPLTILAGEYQLRIQGVSSKIVGKYIFTEKKDYLEAQVAYDNLIKLDRELSKNEDERIPLEIRYRQFLAKLDRSRQAHIVLESALSKGSKQ